MKVIVIKNYKFKLDDTLFPIFDEENKTLTLGNIIFCNFEVFIVVYFLEISNKTYLEFCHFNKASNKYTTTIKDDFVIVSMNKK